MSRNPSKRRHSNEIPEEPLNLIPIMNLLTILIPFLTLSAVFMRLAVLPTTLPSVADTSDAPAAEEPEKKEEDEKPRLNLTVSIVKDGFVVAGAGGVLGGSTEGGPTIPLKDGAYDFKALTDKLVEIKKQYPHEKDLILIPEMNLTNDPAKADIDYQTIIDTMDAVREAPEPIADSDGDGKIDTILFPGVIFSPGIL